MATTMEAQEMVTTTAEVSMETTMVDQEMAITTVEEVSVEITMVEVNQLTGHSIFLISMEVLATMPDPGQDAHAPRQLKYQPYLHQKISMEMEMNRITILDLRQPLRGLTKQLPSLTMEIMKTTTASTIRSGETTSSDQTLIGTTSKMSSSVVVNITGKTISRRVLTTVNIAISVVGGSHERFNFCK